MKPGFFIDRPVFSTVLSLLIVIVGIIGLMLLPVDQYPQITPPVVKISGIAGCSYAARAGIKRDSGYDLYAE